jgi:hypothetical protein
MEKLTSRKFWICVAAMLASIAASISGITTSNQTITIVGTVCGILSAAIYAFCEAWVDGKAVEQERTNVVKLADAITRRLDGNIK